MRWTGLGSARVYPALGRLVDSGQVERHEERVPEGEDRPARALYRLTARPRRTSPPLTPP